MSMRTLLDVVARDCFFLFDQALNCFYQVFEKDLYRHGGNLGGPEGLTL